MDEELEAPEGEEEEAAEAAEEAPEEFPFVTLPSQIQYAVHGVQPPSALYIGPGEQLWVEVFSSLTYYWLDVMLRLLRPDGSIVPCKHRIEGIGGRARTVHRMNLTEGFLLSAVICWDGTGIQRGSTWVKAVISESDPIFGTFRWLLIQGYASGADRLAWPGGRLGSSLDGSGLIRSITGTDPAPGNEISETVPNGVRWRLLSITLTLQTSATVGSRGVWCYFDDGATQLYIQRAAVTQPANSWDRYTILSGMSNQLEAAGHHMFPAPTPIVLRAGWRFRTQTDGMQAGDNWTAPQLWVEEWIEV